MGFLDRGVEIKTPEQIDLMRKAGLVVGQTLELLSGSVRAGISTGELDAIAEDNIRSAGATPSFLGYHGFTGSICASVNDEVVHGMPGDRVLAEGDVISIDCGAIVSGWHGDAAITVAVGPVPDEVTELMRVTEQSMWHGIAAARLGGRVVPGPGSREVLQQTLQEPGPAHPSGQHGDAGAGRRVLRHGSPRSSAGSSAD